MITGNKGEWSEIYAFMRLLSEGRLFAANEQMNRIEEMFFPIRKIIREEIAGNKYEYRVRGENVIHICLGDGEPLIEVSANEFDVEARQLYGEITNPDLVQRTTFSIARTEEFMRKIHVTKLCAPSMDKTDINIQLHDVNTGFESIVGFSIKSELGSAPTLLNAGKTTNFKYKVDGLSESQITEINAINTRKKIKDRMKAITESGGKLSFVELGNEVFNGNLVMIDSQMPAIVACMLTGHYEHNIDSCINLLDYVTKTNPLKRPERFYRHKIKEFLCAVALGMKPATEWDGMCEATGGYIVVKTNGDVLAYHIHNRDSFMSYLLANTRFERGGTDRHDFARLYQAGGNLYINLNLQIRFT